MGLVEEGEILAGDGTGQHLAGLIPAALPYSAPFTIAEEKVNLPAAGRIQQSSLEMPVGAVSDLIGTATGGLVFHLRDRKPADLAEFEKDRERITRQVLQRDRQALFNDWIQALVRGEQVDFKIPRRQAEAEEPATDSTN